MKNFKSSVGFVAAAVMLLSGCVNVSTANVDQGVDLATLKSMYVQQNPEDKRGVNQLIVSKLQSKGVSASTGTSDPKSKVDAVVTYKDVWIWDWSTYLLDLTILMKNPTTEQIIASGNSRHGSLTRLTPPEMVSEVIDKIYSSSSSTGVVTTTNEGSTPPSQPDNKGNLQKLQDLKLMLDKGVITKAEYDQKKKAILEQM